MVAYEKNVYFWKECLDIHDFLHGYIYQGKVAFETTTFGWVFPSMLKQAQTCLDMTKGLLGSFRGIAMLKIIGIKELILSERKYFFKLIINTISSYRIKCALQDSLCSTSSIYQYSRLLLLVGFGQACPMMSRFGQNMSQEHFGWSGGGMVTLNIVQKERSSKLKMSFLM